MERLRIDLEIRSLSIGSPCQKMTVCVDDRLGNGGSLCIQEKNRLPIWAIQFNGYELSNRSREETEQAAIGGDGKWDFIDRLKFIGEFNQSRRAEAINVKRGLQRGLRGLRSAGKKNSDQ